LRGRSGCKIICSAEKEKESIFTVVVVGVGPIKRGMGVEAHRGKGERETTVKAGLQLRVDGSSKLGWGSHSFFF